MPRVEVMRLQPTVFDEPIVGYGTVRPKRQVKIIPQVNGQLVKVHKDLAVGNIIHKGEVLFEIDPRTYDARVRQVDAEIGRLETALKSHEQEKASVEQRLVLARREVELAKQALERERSLLSRGSVTAPEAEAAEERLLQYQDAVLNYENRLALIPLQVQETTALLATKRAMLDEAKLNLEYTKILCPFDARVDSVTAQISQVVIAGLQIATLTDMEALELSVVIDPRELRWTDAQAFASAVGRDQDDAPEALVTWTLLGHEYTWRGRVTRLERLDEVTRTAHVVVELRDVMASLEIGRGHSRPPLSVGMFCRAKLPTAPLEGALVIPRHAVQAGDVVYVFEPEAEKPQQGRLAVRRVTVLRTVGDEALVAFEGAARADEGTEEARSASSDVCELAAGDQVILSLVPRAVEGMKLTLRGEGESSGGGQLARRSDDAGTRRHGDAEIFVSRRPVDWPSLCQRPDLLALTGVP